MITTIVVIVSMAKIRDRLHQLPVLLGLAVGAGLGPPGAAVNDEAP